ncbi:amino acid transport protein [Catenovulum sp. SM1970]|uniref:amino acid transport protein n=1 Tax=Marinifaba aquimaris TaxID=2741323 RepID=UPI0015721B09|nr:amino acid transport protein [Marinifaba aquimaris]NTS75516.1 amino acid transport protein [Marinifaba aquimaris]
MTFLFILIGLACAFYGYKQKDSGYIIVGLGLCALPFFISALIVLLVLSAVLLVAPKLYKKLAR